MTLPSTIKFPLDGNTSTNDALEYAESIINTVREPLIVLDKDLVVVLASRSFYEVFKPSGVRRPELFK